MNSSARQHRPATALAFPSLGSSFEIKLVGACARIAPMGRQQKITFGEMRASGAVRIIVHCGDYKCGHSVTMYPALWPDNVRLSDLEDRFVCTACGHRGADVRPAV